MSLRGSPIRRLQLFNKQSNSQILALQLEIERLGSAIHSKNLQIKQLYDENTLMKLNYQEQLTESNKTIKLLQQQLRAVQISRTAQFDVIKEKYDKLSLEESQNMKSYHSHQIQFLLKEIASLRVDCLAKEQKIITKDKQIASLGQSYQRELEQKISEINNLTRNLLSIEETKNRQIKQINTKRQLQKSRTSGIVSSRKQNNQFMDKQIRKLNQQILQKSIKIQNLTREVNKTKRKAEQSEKSMSKKIQDIIQQKQQQSRERQQHFVKVQKSLKQQILEFKSSEIKYLGQIDSLKSLIQAHKSDIKRNEDTIKSRQQEIAGYKQILQKQRQDHAKQIANLMKQKRRRSSNLGSSRSLGSSMKDASGAASMKDVKQGASGNQQPSHSVGLKKLDSIRLATVKQQSPDKSLSRSLERSNLTQEEHGEEQNELAKIILHYDTIVQQLKRSHASQIQLLKHKLQKSTKNLDEKQQQLLDMLTRFSPLVKIHAEQKTVQEDRKQRIERHWKADLALLQIMLDKYRIKAFE